MKGELGLQLIGASTEVKVVGAIIEDGAEVGSVSHERAGDA